METDRLSRSSLDSSQSNFSNPGDEFVIVHAEPKLKIANNGNMSELEENLTEVLSDGEESTDGAKLTFNGFDKEKLEKPAPPKCMILSSKSMEQIMADTLNVERNYDVRFTGKNTVSNPDITSPTGRVVKNPFDEKERELANPPVKAGDADIECTIFHGVTYLGSATVNAPRSEVEINRNMAVLNEQSMMAIPVTLSVPHNAEGIVKLLEPSSNTEIATFKIYRILFCARGSVETEERRCFAFTCSHGDRTVNAIFQCHVFRCDQHESVGKILYRFATSFRRLPKSPSSQMSDVTSSESSPFIFNVTLDFKEDDGKGNFYTVPKDRSIFKLRCNVEKKIVIVVQQVANVELKIERCFGLLISPGRNVKNNDMHLIDMVSMGNSNDGKSYLISGSWDPVDSVFQVLNTETTKDTRVFMTIAVDLVFVGIQEPVRFLIETKARIHPANERFWVFNKKPVQEQFHLYLKEAEAQNGSDRSTLWYDVVKLESQSEMDRRKANLSLSLSPTRQQPEHLKSPDESSDGDEPLPSGSGIVSKDVTDEQLLDSWHDVLTRWHQNLLQRPKQVHSLSRKCIPEALRGEVWQLLSGCRDNKDMYENYRILISKDSSCEQIILRDINRTFPAHDYFRETGGVGQDSLYKISKAYSIYDEEIGYCQGLSFLAAALLLHMPEEQAFCVLVKIMFDYGHRELFKQGFEELHLKFYQLERLMHDYINDLHCHFIDMGLEAHMFASQWFLTLFTAKFPLFMVFHILDVYLSEGMETIFRVALALLKTSRKDLLALDFEGILKYFRVQLPKKFRSEESAKEFMQTAMSTKVTKKRLHKYEKEYLTMKEQELQSEDPLERLEQKLQRMQEANMRLEQENDDLAHELVTSKIALRNDLDNAEDRCDYLNKELLTTKSLLVDTEDEKARLDTEAAQLKEMCRRELDRSESENSRNSAIIADYKQICSQLSERLEKQQTGNKEEMRKILALVQKCESCSKLVTPDGKATSADITALTDDDINPRLVDAQRLIRELELELAQTKLALVEAQCKTQDLTHDLNSAMNEIQSSKNTWFQKTFSSIKEATSKKELSKEAGN